MGCSVEPLVSCETRPYSLHSFQCFTLRIPIGLNYFNKKLDISKLQDFHLSDEIQKLSSCHLSTAIRDWSKENPICWGDTGFDGLSRGPTVKTATVGGVASLHVVIPRSGLNPS